MMNFKTFIEKIKKLFVKEKPKKKIALALGSGGAKGMAHLGALKAFEEEGITFDVVCGTSIGSIVGGLYACGYSVTDMEQVLSTINFSDYIRSFRPNMDMAPIERLLENYIDKNIEELPIPYRAVATNKNTMTKKAIESGSCARAMCASSAMPPFFASVKIGEEEYFDGAFSDAIPADVCRELGADVVFGIDLSTESAAPQGGIRGLISALLTPDVQANEDAKTIGYENSDLVIKPDLSGFSALSVSGEKRGEMYNRGYEAVKAHMNEIKEIIEKVNGRK